MTKAQLYAELADDLAQFWHRDEALLERNPEAWEQAVVIDNWLCQHRDNPRVGLEQYNRNCQRLLDIYHVGPKPHPKEAPGTALGQTWVA